MAFASAAKATGIGPVWWSGDTHRARKANIVLIMISMSAMKLVPVVSAYIAAKKSKAIQSTFQYAPVLLMQTEKGLNIGCITWNLICHVPSYFPHERSKKDWTRTHYWKLGY
ncbi:uncharacterized protein [Lolium perenne]|uniref:uncharacterized protein n=1 Tax=Lolium perenne TaxID=4522 RepID=UPI003A997757